MSTPSRPHPIDTAINYVAKRTGMSREEAKKWLREHLPGAFTRGELKSELDRWMKERVRRRHRYIRPTFESPTGLEDDEPSFDF